MRYFKLFSEQSEFESYKNSPDFVVPNVSFVEGQKGIHFVKTKPEIVQRSVGDVAYWDGNKIQTASLTDYNESMGQAVGVVVISSNFLPDGKARMIALNQNNTRKIWAKESIDISDLINYDRFPITDNSGSTSIGSNSFGYLPSTMFSGTLSFSDKISRYSLNITDNLIPSPYLSGNIFNTEYIKSFDGYNNALSDFNGKHNTDILVSLGSDYEAANHARNYNDGVSNAEWYLPTMGEIGVMLSRLEKINYIIGQLKGIMTPGAESGAGSAYMWSSNEKQDAVALSCNLKNGSTTSMYKSGDMYVRSFAMID